jgi:hypothetical protein
MKNSLVNQLLKTKFLLILLIGSVIVCSSWTHTTKNRRFIHQKSIEYSMTQRGVPYLDANLEVSLNGQVVDFFATNNSGSFLSYYFNDIIKIDCPIYDQWEDIGKYHLSVIGYDPNTGSTTILKNINLTRDWTNTPDVNILSYSFKPWDLPSGCRIVYINLTAQ